MSRRWNELSLAWKIVIGFIAVSLVGVGTMAGVSTYQMRRMNEAAAAMDAEGAQVLAATGAARAEVVSTEMVVHELMVALAVGDDTTGMADEIVAHLDGAATAVEAIDSDTLAEDREQFLTSWAAYDAAIRNEIMPLLDRGDVAGAGRAMFRSSDAHFDAATAAVEQLSARAEATAADGRRLADDTYRETLRDLLMIAGGVALLGAAAAWLIARRIIRPIRAAVAALSTVADGDLTQRVAVTSHDELGQLGDALNRTVEATATSVGQVQSSAEALAAAAGRLSSLSDQLSTSAEQTRGRAVSVGAAADQVSSNTAQAVEGANDVGTAVAEIAASGTQAAVATSAAIGQVRETEALARSLRDSSSAIDDIVKVINAVAGQTHMLALNATIEAARAGAAGKGFAVVAAEVKELAHQTSTATGDIAARVDAIRADADRVATAIAAISEVVEEVQRMQSVVSAAVEEHTATTAEMGRSMTQIADGSAQISRTIAEVAEEATETAAAAGTVRASAGDLDRLAEELTGSVANFRTSESADDAH